MLITIKPALVRVLPRLAERSTVVGLLSLLSLALGFVIAPERVDAIATVTTAVAGIALVLLQEASSLPLEAQVVAKIMEKPE